MPLPSTRHRLLIDRHGYRAPRGCRKGPRPVLAEVEPHRPRHVERANQRMEGPRVSGTPDVNVSPWSGGQELVEEGYALEEETTYEAVAASMEIARPQRLLYLRDPVGLLENLDAKLSGSRGAGAHAFPGRDRGWAKRRSRVGAASTTSIMPWRHSAAWRPLAIRLVCNHSHYCKQHRHRREDQRDHRHDDRRQDHRPHLRPSSAGVWAGRAENDAYFDLKSVGPSL